MLKRVGWQLAIGIVVGSAIAVLALIQLGGASTESQLTTRSGPVGTGTISSERPQAASAVDTVRESAPRLVADPESALRDALAVRGDLARRQSVLDTARIWAGMAPLDALAAAETVPVELQAAYRTTVIMEWANVDPVSFFENAERADDMELFKEGLRLLVPTDPERVFGLAARLREDADYETGTNTVQIAAVRALADRDPVTAIRVVEAMSNGGEINVRFLRDVALRLGRDSPDAALAWHQTLDDPPSAVWDSLVAGIGASDFDRALELASTSPLPGNFVYSFLARSIITDRENAAAVASSLLGRTDGDGQQMLYMMLSPWVGRDAEGAMDWLLDNRGRIDPATNRAMAIHFAKADIATALDQVDRLPPELRAPWLIQIAGSLGEEDPVAAFEWVDQYRGQAGFDDVLTTVVMQAAAVRPDLVADRFATLSESLQRMAAPTMVSAWAQRDPVQAAAWLEAQAANTATARPVNDRLVPAESAVSGLIRLWVMRDADAAESWARSLNRGALRDAALSQLITNARNTEFDVVDLLDQIESAELRPDATMRAAFLLRNRGEYDDARRLAEQFVGDPERGRTARELIEAIDKERASER